MKERHTGTAEIHNSFKIEVQSFMTTDVARVIVDRNRAEDLLWKECTQYQSYLFFLNLRFLLFLGSLSTKNPDLIFSFSYKFLRFLTGIPPWRLTRHNTSFWVYQKPYLIQNSDACFYLCIIELRKMCHYDSGRFCMHRMSVTDTRHESSPKNRSYGCQISPPIPRDRMEQFKLTKISELEVPKFVKPEYKFLILDLSPNRDSFNSCAIRSLHFSPALNGIQSWHD